MLLPSLKRLGDWSLSSLRFSSMKMSLKRVKENFKVMRGARIVWKVSTYVWFGISENLIALHVTPINFSLINLFFISYWSHVEHKKTAFETEP